MTMIVAAMMLFGCSKDEETKDPAEVVKNLTSTTWEGEVKELRRNGSNWEEGNQTHWAVIRFNAAGTSALNGTGYQLEFRNENISSSDNLTDKSTFTWRLDGDLIRIIYDNREWNSVYINFNAASLSMSNFEGEMFDNENMKYKFYFKFRSTGFNDFANYFRL